MNAESTREALDVASLAGDILLASGAARQGNGSQPALP